MNYRILFLLLLTLPVYATAGKRPTAADSVKVVEQHAQKGDAVAQNTLGSWYYTGVKVKKDYRQAFTWWGRSAAQNNNAAIANMALCYRYGTGTKQDSLMAVRLYQSAFSKGNAQSFSRHEAAAKNGSLFSLRLLQECYAKGVGVKSDRQKALDYLKLIAAATGDADTLYTTALKLLNANQATEAAPLFRRAAEKRHPAGTYYFGLLLFQGMGVKQDKEQGFNLLLKAAGKGMRAAAWQVGRAFYEGDAVKQDMTAAVRWLRAALPNAKAAWLLAQCCVGGKGTATDYHAATLLTAESYRSHRKEFNALMAEKDNPYRTFLLALKHYYADKDYRGALDLIKVVKKGSAADANTLTALILDDSNYPKHNEKKAIKLLEQAVKEGNPRAAWQLSRHCLTGEGMKTADRNRAIELVRKAAEGYVPEALCELGDRAYSGDGVQQDYTLAARSYLMAEALNHLSTKSAANMIRLYQVGIAALPDLADAKKRMEQLKKVKVNNNLTDMLKAVKE